MTAPETWFCGDLIAFWENGGRRRTVLACVDEPDHDPSEAHRSGTEPVVRWRVNPQDPSVRDLWVDRSADFRGRPADQVIIDDPAARLP